MNKKILFIFVCTGIIVMGGVGYLNHLSQPQIDPYFLGTWVFDIEKTLSKPAKNIKITQEERRKNTNIIYGNSTMEICPDGQIIRTYPDEKFINYLKILKATPSSLILEGTNEFNIKFQMYFKKESEEYISVYTLVLPMEKDRKDNPAAYFKRKE